MSDFARPTLQNLRDTALAAFSAIPGVVPMLRRSVMRAEAYLIAGLLHLVYGYLDWMVVNVLNPVTSTGSYLDRYLNAYGIPRESAAFAAGTAIFTGTAAGLPVPAGTILQSPDGVSQYATQATVEAVLAAGASTASASIGIIALTAGSDANQPAGTVLTLVSGVPGITATATVDSNGLTGGLDVESDASAQIRLAQRLAEVPQGGAPWDYQGWAKTVPGVTRAWVYPKSRGPGTVDVSFVLDGRSDILPLTADVTAVQAAIDLKRPVTADSIAFALTAVPVAVTIANLVAAEGSTIAVAQAGAQAALAALFATTTPLASYGDGIITGQTGGTLPLEQIDAAINSGAGVGSFDLTAPTADVVVTATQLATLGPVTFS